MGIFSNAQGQLALQSVVGPGQNSNSSELLCMSSLPVSTKEIQEKSGNIDFLDAQGQVTLWSGVRPSRISNSSKLLCMSSLPASMKRIRSKTAEKT